MRNTWIAGLAIAVAVLVPASVTWACSSHGSVAGAWLQDWIASNFDGSTGITIDAAGTQSRTAGAGTSTFQGDELNVLNGGGSGGWNANAEYWVDISLPGETGGKFTVRYVAPGNKFSSGDQVEQALFKAGKDRIQEWFKTYQAADQPGEGFVG